LEQVAQDGATLQQFPDGEPVLGVVGAVAALLLFLLIPREVEHDLEFGRRVGQEDLENSVICNRRAVNMAGSRAVSLYAGTTTVRSGLAGSARVGSGTGVVGEERER